MNEEEAMALYESGWWEGKTASEILALQLYEERLSMPFWKFHEAVEEGLGRGVGKHEFGDAGSLQREYEALG